MRCALSQGERPGWRSVSRLNVLSDVVVQGAPRGTARSLLQISKNTPSLITFRSFLMTQQESGRDGDSLEEDPGEENMLHTTGRKTLVS